MFKIIYDLNAYMMMIKIEIGPSTKKVVGHSLLEFSKTLVPSCHT